MFVFACAGCGAELTVPLSPAALPPHAHQKYGNGLQLGVLMEAGTFAVDPDGAPGSVVLAPGDVRGTRLLPERAAGSCCGLDGAEGPNMACATCGLPVASRIDDCSLWQAVWLAPGAVRPVLVDDTAAPPATCGPGLPVPDAGADIVLVPVHPQTGETWTPDAAAHPVPLPFGVWRWLAFPRPHLTLPASGGLPDGVLRDDPPAPRPRSLFRADPGVFRHALARLPAARSPWFREISENLAQYVRAGLF
ncbi:hypothetical protein [Streptomyces bacillaris]|uniref:hypothetical protein n=1 Tax=Streptomyces bacillaris TaxID=68179 RepID=UPI00345F5C76